VADLLVSEAEDVSTFDAVYATYFDFVWTSLRRLGVAESSLDDAVQDAFLVVHRQFGGFDGRSRLKTWLFGIALRVARDHRRRIHRKGGLESLPDGPDAGPARSSRWRSDAARSTSSSTPDVGERCLVAGPMTWRPRPRRRSVRSTRCTGRRLRA
jgi:DNA-directed RNA polymerase specialized sigma24 family protein